MQVTVRFYATFREIAGEEELSLNLDDQTTVEVLLRKLFERYGDKLKNVLIDSSTGNLAKYVKIFKNGRDIDFLGGLKATLSDGDLIVMFPPVAGGLKSNHLKFDLLHQ